MTKLYKKLQDLFPKELSVGDVVKSNKKQYTILEQTYPFGGRNQYLVSGGITLDEKFFKLIRKNITLPMVLEAMNKKRIIYHIVLPIYEPTFKEITIEISERQIKKKCRWQLRKEGKDLDLFDQSEELIKLVWEVLS